MDEVDDELARIAAGELAPRDTGWVLREMRAAVAELDAARRARWQQHAADRQRGLETWLAAREALGITDVPSLPWWASEPPPVTIL